MIKRLLLCIIIETGHYVILLVRVPDKCCQIITTAFDYVIIKIPERYSKLVLVGPDAPRGAVSSAACPVFTGRQLFSFLLTGSTDSVPSIWLACRDSVNNFYWVCPSGQLSVRHRRYYDSHILPGFSERSLLTGFSSLDLARFQPDWLCSHYRRSTVHQ